MLAIVFFGLAVLLFSLAARPAEKIAQTLTWQYRNREANEPSDAAILANRTQLAIGGIGATVAGVVSLLR
ncbi:hypothetical protein JGS22_007850 [Streptomyces sp. P38-E01]|uniref:DUF6199 domain-containing protein n=1 Tax=Streptomyces tardus TaxID=2780544 RepID=A0A949JEL0_9ACTN|nr:hypothetical protein [Streptomyces tardus]MBU7597538.1 hypothetical protein [Streptomyces tardus]